MLFFHATFEAFSLPCYHVVGPQIQSCYFDRVIDASITLDIQHTNHNCEFCIPLALINCLHTDFLTSSTADHLISYLFFLLLSRLNF
jgi:hypothetical protein